MSPHVLLRRMVVSCAAVCALMSCAGAPVAHADGARLEYRGGALSRRQVETLAAPALSAPGDSMVTAALLGAVVGRLQSAGYLDAHAEGSWDSTRSTLRLEVREGTRLRFHTIQISTPSREDSLGFARALGLAAGQWASPDAVREAIERTLNEVVDHGHPYAVLGVNAWRVDSAGVDLTLSGGLGPGVTISEVRLEGLKVTQPSIVEKSMGRLVGLPYSRGAAEAARGRVLQLGLFSNVTFEGLEGERDWSRGRLVYRLEEPRYNRFEGAVGVQGEAGAVGAARLDLGNLLGTGRAMGLSWESRGRGVMHFGGRYAEPLVFGTPFRLEGAFDQQVQDTFYVRTRFGVRGVLPLGGADRIEAGYDQERVVQERNLVEQANIRSTMFALEHVTVDVPGAPRGGARIRIAAAQSFKDERLRPAGNRSARSSAVELSSEWHRRLSRRSGATLELSAAGRFSSEPVLPLFERYPLGGAASLRGYDEEAFRVDRYVLTRFEWRWFIGNGGQRAFVFWDHAYANTRVDVVGGGNALQQIDRDGVGFGLRLLAGSGLVGLDYGLEPGRPPLEGKIHLRLVSTF